MFGHSGPLSPSNSSKFDTLKHKSVSENDAYKDTVVPKKYGGMIIKLDQQQLQNITQIDCNNYGSELASAIPATNPHDFTTNLGKNKPSLQGANIQNHQAAGITQQLIRDAASLQTSNTPSTNVVKRGDHSLRTKSQNLR
jgi:hypothetical protein